MNAEQTEKLRKLIDKEIEELKLTIERVKDTVQPVVPDDAIGRLTRMEAINAKSVSEATLRSYQARLNKLKSALHNIDEPDFGICAGCEEPIPFKRLMVMPESRMCVSCIENR
ncbi:MAG: TraR/DksA C4-type zinc finger protein [Nitrospiraceae bacterium]|nr:MAG: TraR/DksA C4-type zinc finger protein [Nitrospiraceae bacterium]